MLNWWLGKAPTEEPTSGEDGIDPPDTPAPVFAARAFKSAIFGTPKPVEEDEQEVLDKHEVNAIPHRRANSTAGIASPTKPQGILLTPGTITRRKTVSFGAAVVDKESKDAVVRSGLPSDCLGKFPSPWPTKAEPVSQSTRRTALTRTLESAREGKSKKSTSSRAARSKPQSLLDLDLPAGTSEEPENPEVVQHGEKGSSRMLSGTEDSFDGDMTVDLNEPHSQSGKYWKSEYERYHEEAKQQMKKLVKYKQLAKSYAKKKDGEAIDLGGKLKEEQEKVKTMEEKITQLVAQIAERRIAGNDDDAPELMKDLARQTAIAVQYRDQVDQFEAAMRQRSNEIDQQGDSDGQKTVSPRTAKTLVETSNELKKAREKLQEMSSLRTEMHSLRLSLGAAERRAARLQEENSKLVRELAKANAELDKSEKRRQSADFLSQKRDELLAGLHKNYDDLKDKAKSQRQEAQDLLKKRHDQVSGLKKELVALKSKTSIDEPKLDLQKIGFNDRIDPTAVNIATEDLMAMETPPQLKSHTNAPQGRGRHDLESRERAKASPDHDPAISQPIVKVREDIHLLDSKIPVSYRSTLRSPNDRALGRPASSDEPQPSLDMPQPKHPALSEIINGGSAPSSPKITTTPLSASFQERFSSLSLKSPKGMLPFSEPSDSNQPNDAFHNKNSSGVPSAATMASNGPSTKRAHLTLDSALQTENSTHAGNIATSRLSSLSSSRARTSLPADRAAAAKARLEQRNAEKKLAQTTDRQKENIKP